MENEPIFTRQVSTGTRVYYIDINEDGKGQRYLSITEKPTDKKPGQKKSQKVFIHEQNVERFAKAFSEVAQWLKCQ